jgi:hypothetical protein
MTTRDLVRQVLEQLPEDAELEDVIERLYFLHKLQQRLTQADTTLTLTHSDAEQRMQRWLR